MPTSSDLSPRQRAEQYRELERDARREAANAEGSVKLSYTIIAETWERLAGEAEAEAKRLVPSES